MELKLKIRNQLFVLLNRLDNNNNADIYKNGEYKLLVDRFKQFTGKQFVLFDVGANVGSFSALAYQAFQRQAPGKKISIHAFEPLPSTFSQLRNQLSGDHYTLVNSGLSETPGTAEIMFNELTDSCASLYQRAEVYSPSRKSIQLTRLDSYMQHSGIDHIDFLKVDTEGHELSVLRSAGDMLTPKCINAIQFEYGGTYLDSRIYLRDLYNLLQAKGYDIYKIYKNGIRQREYHSALENFQYANYVAIG